MEDNTLRSGAVKVKTVSKFQFGVILVLQVLIWLVFPQTVARIFDGGATWVEFYYFILAILGALGIWIIIRNSKGKTNIPLWLGQLFGFLPLIFMAVAGIFMFWFVLAVKYI